MGRRLCPPLCLCATTYEQFADTIFSAVARKAGAEEPLIPGLPAIEPEPVPDPVVPVPVVPVPVVPVPVVPVPVVPVPIVPLPMEPAPPSTRPVSST